MPMPPLLMSSCTSAFGTAFMRPSAPFAKLVIAASSLLMSMGCRCGEYVSQSSDDLAPKDLELLRGGCKGGLKLDSLFYEQA